MDQSLANQLTLLTLTSAISQQQLNGAAARNQVGAMATALITGVQMTHMAGLNQLFKISPMAAASVSNLLSAGLPQHIAGLRTVHVVPEGQHTV